MEEKSLFEILIDENNNDPITLVTNGNKEVKFDQVGVFPYEEKLYTILKPIDKMEGVADNEAIVFALDEDENGEINLSIEEDVGIAERVFDEYYKLLNYHNQQS